MVYFLFGKMLSLLWHICDIIGLIFIIPTLQEKSRWPSRLIPKCRDMSGCPIPSFPRFFLAILVRKKSGKIEGNRDKSREIGENRGQSRLFPTYLELFKRSGWPSRLIPTLQEKSRWPSRLISPIFCSKWPNIENNLTIWSHCTAMINKKAWLHPVAVIRLHDGHLRAVGFVRVHERWWPQ